MSDDGTMATGASETTGDTGPKPHETSGEQPRPEPGPTAGQADALAEFVKQQPVTVALAALIIGYLLGKIA